MTVLTDSDVLRVRKLLRTDLSTEEICEQLGVPQSTLKGFIKKYQMPNLTDRQRILKQKTGLLRREAV